MDRDERTFDSLNADVVMTVARQSAPATLVQSMKSVVFVSAVHDFRMLKRGSIQSLASAMARMGHAVTFISVRFSFLSLLKGDLRNFLLQRSNRPELVNGVLCYLWFTAIHPFQSQNEFVELLLRPHYVFHKRRKNRFLDDQFRNQYPDCCLPEWSEVMGADLGNEPSTANAPVITISLVICTFGDRQRQLTRLIRSLSEQRFRAFEIVLVDQNPPGYLDEVLETECGGLILKHVRSDPGLSIARNAGLLAATGDIVGFPDDDCWYFPETLMQVASFFGQNPSIDILLGRTVDEFGQPSLSPLRKESGSVDRSNVWISGNSNTLFVSKDAIPSSGAFDEKIGVGAPSRYQSGEETDFILRLMKNKARPVYINHLKIGHDQVGNAGAGRELKRAWMYSLGFGYVLKKQEYGFMYCCYRVGRSIISATWATARLRPVYGLSRLVWATGTLVGYLTAKHSLEDK